MFNSDAANKATALSRIRQLSSGGLPLEAFVRSAFALIDEAVPTSHNRGMHVGGGSNTFVCDALDVQRIIPLHDHYFVRSAPEVSGAKFTLDLDSIRRILPTKTIFLEHEGFQENFRKAEGFNEAYRPLGWHHPIAVSFHEAGIFVGYYGMWRSVDQKPFSKVDIEFLRAMAPHIAHGLKVAQRAQRVPGDFADFAPLAGWGTGVILLNRKGKPIAMDSTASVIFQQVGMLDGVLYNASAAREARYALEYVARTLSNIFDEPDGASIINPPVFRLYQHWSGIVLSLRGVRMTGTEGREYVGVLVERGETLAVRRTRLVARWGLSPREAEVLELIRNGKTGPEIAVLLAISHDTVRKHTSKILDKLGVETRTAAAMTLDATL